MENQNKNLNITEHAIVLVIVCFIGLIANHSYQFATQNPDLGFISRIISAPLSLISGLLQSLPGMLFLYALCLIGLILAKLAPFYLPSIAWISLLAVIASSPIFPLQEWVLQSTSSIAGLPLTTAILAYAGFAIADQEVKIFKTSGLKILFVSLLVFIGTYVGSAFIASFILSSTGA